MRWRLVGAARSSSRSTRGCGCCVAAGATSLEGVLITIPVIAVLVAGGNWLQHWLGIQRRSPQFSRPSRDAEPRRRDGAVDVNTLPRRGDRAAHLQARRVRPDLRAAHPRARQGPRGRPRGPQDLVAARREDGGARPRRRAARTRAHRAPLGPPGPAARRAERRSAATSRACRRRWSCWRSPTRRRSSTWRTPSTSRWSAARSPSLETAEDPSVVTTAFLLKTLVHDGAAPVLDRCASCGEADRARRVRPHRGRPPVPVVPARPARQPRGGGAAAPDAPRRARGRARRRAGPRARARSRRSRSTRWRPTSGGASAPRASSTRSERDDARRRGRRRRVRRLRPRPVLPRAVRLLRVRDVDRPRPPHRRVRRRRCTPSWRGAPTLGEHPRGDVGLLRRRHAVAAARPRTSAACSTRSRRAAGAEVTSSATPRTWTSTRLAAYRAAGVTRISLGIQSTSARVLRSLGRRHGTGALGRASRRRRRRGLHVLERRPHHRGHRRARRGPRAARWTTCSRCRHRPRT